MADWSHHLLEDAEQHPCGHQASEVLDDPGQGHDYAPANNEDAKVR